MKKYLVVLTPKKDVPANRSWNVAIARVRLYVIAEDTKSARELAVSAMELHDLYGKVTYIRELKGE